jgi:hypothetical protein
VDYHWITADEIALFPELDLPKGTKQEHAARVKTAVLRRPARPPRNSLTRPH